jgi:hypothetical protein
MASGGYEERNMTEALSTKSKTASGGKLPPGRLFVIELSGGRIHSMNTDGSHRKTIVTDCRNPDGIVVDTEAGHIYWTNMGIPNLNDGSIERVDFDGKNRKVIVSPGGTFTPKQIHLDKKDGRLYWCDREGMRVMRCNLDGSKLETLVEAGSDDADRRDQTRWCVGITIDPKRKQISAGSFGALLPEDHLANSRRPKCRNAYDALERRRPIGSAKRIRHVILGQQGNDVKYFTIPRRPSSKGAPPSVLRVRIWHLLPRCPQFGRYRGNSGHGADSAFRSRLT